jgi:hypothetical protein
MYLQPGARVERSLESAPSTLRRMRTADRGRRDSECASEDAWI